MSSNPPGPSPPRGPPRRLRSFAAELEAAGERVVVRARGRLDSSTMAEMAFLLAKAIASAERGVVVDLRGIDSIDLEHLGLIARARSLLHARGQSLVVESPWPRVDGRVYGAPLE